MGTEEAALKVKEIQTRHHQIFFPSFCSWHLPQQDKNKDGEIQRNSLPSQQNEGVKRLIQSMLIIMTVGKIVSFSHEGSGFLKGLQYLPGGIEPFLL